MCAEQALSIGFEPANVNVQYSCVLSVTMVETGTTVEVPLSGAGGHMELCFLKPAHNNNAALNDKPAEDQAASQSATSRTLSALLFTNAPELNHTTLEPQQLAEMHDYTVATAMGCIDFG